MKAILFKRRCDSQNRLKAFSILQSSEDKECVTKIRKSFRYALTEVERVEPPQSPNVHIKKYFNSQRIVEKFTFQVVGGFYLNHKRGLFKVHFHHTLNIHIYWKDKTFSPKKSQTV